MNFDWSLYIQLADELITHQRTPDLHEAYLRTAISRSYYCVFCISRNLLVKRGVTIRKVDTHRFVRDNYWKSPDRIEKKIGKDLLNLWRERKEADYEDGANVDINRAKTAHQLAIRILEKLKAIGAT